MNQIQPTPKVESTKSQMSLTKSEVAAIHRMLISGEHAVAKKADLAELHKRNVQLFATLKDGLGAMSEKKAAEDRASVLARLDEMEQSVNSMEGMLRIEMAPKLREMLNEMLEEVQPRKSRMWPRALAVVLCLGIGLAVGARFSTELTAFAATAQTKITDVLEKN
jgi:hypothetical protein